MKASLLLKSSFHAIASILVLTTIGISPAKATLFTETADAGDSIATAIEIGSGFDGIQGYQFASPLPSDTHDFFKMTFDTDVQLKIFNLVWPATNPANASIHLYDESGSVISECFNCFHSDANQGTEILTGLTGNQSYFIEVRNTTGDAPDFHELSEYQFSFSAVSIPEPTSLMLLGLSGLAVLLDRRRS